jgi:hypothetical protein
VDHHALGEKAGERFVEIDVPGGTHRAGEEPAVEQVQDRMLVRRYAIDRHHAVCDRAIGGLSSTGR